ncbi:MAG: hypothetical protein WC650_05125 [Candidatus Doudnabacteria bacterium]
MPYTNNPHLPACPPKSASGGRRRKGEMEGVGVKRRENKKPSIYS